MKIVFLVFVLTVCGCFLFPPAPQPWGIRQPRPEEIEKEKIYDFVPAAPDRFMYGNLTKCKVGDYVWYDITTRDKKYTLRIYVVKKQQENLWIEIIKKEQHKITTCIQLVTPDREVLKSYYAQPPRPAVTQKLESYQPEQVNKLDPLLAESYPEASIQTKAGVIKNVTREEKTFVDRMGNLIHHFYWWSKDIPQLYAGSEFGGLIKKQTPLQTVEIIKFGSGAKPPFPIPE